MAHKASRAYEAILYSVRRSKDGTEWKRIGVDS